MILSQTSVYALKAVLHLAETAHDEFVRVDDIAADLKVPRNYLSKILHTLARAGVLGSTRGPHGGFRLAKNPAKLTLDDVLAPFDEVVGESACLLGRARCNDANPCAAHDRWKGVYAGVKTFFQETTVADLANGATIPEVTVR